ncbi:MAG: putative 2-aminoethylphosphonate ABC transporter ATP-binding protein [Alphaproteobacteria bacterium]|nr:putative 2-aminoethylphosphonate ABC transporter ATP-binding protein [Alphaproteobacteria bacterium]
MASNGTAGGPYLAVRRLTKSFGAFQALKEVSLEVRRGEFVCFLGPSGCGKTTLLRAIAGLDPQSSGTIEQDGRDVSNLPPGQRDFGIVFQSYALFPNLTIAANVGYGLASRGQGREAIAARVTELLALVGLSDQGAKYPAQLSGGQQQRVALARALAPSPGLLLLDEPLSALDALVRVHLRREIKALQRRLGVTTIMVTHDQEEALTMADRIVVMDHGVIEQVGSPVEIYRNPRTPFVADFVGRMNLLEAKVAGSGRVELGALSIAVADTAGLSPGTGALLCFRPEDVQVRGIETGAANALEVLIGDIEFHGAYCRAALSAGQGAGAVGLVAEFSINLMRDLAPETGKRLRIALPPERLRVFARDSAGR